MGKVAQGVQLQDRAQALSLPIHTLALVNGAARIATKLAARVGDAVGFDEVLLLRPEKSKIMARQVKQMESPR